MDSFPLCLVISPVTDELIALVETNTLIERVPVVENYLQKPLQLFSEGAIEAIRWSDQGAENEDRRSS
jgi:hypothetical protein